MIYVKLYMIMRIKTKERLLGKPPLLISGDLWATVCLLCTLHTSECQCALTVWPKRLLQDG